MKTYIKFISFLFLKSFFFVFFATLGLVVILNVLSELDFFKNLIVNTNLILSLALLNSPSFIFDIFPFIFLLTTQLFFISLFNRNEITIFKYSGLKNSSIILIISCIALIMGILIVTLFYNFSSNFKNIYLKLKSPYTDDGKYLAVVTKNGLWIRDKFPDRVLIINSSKIENDNLIDNFITEFDENYNVKRNIWSDRINIKSTKWLIFNPTIFVENNYQNLPDGEVLELVTNFDYEKIQNLFSDLYSLSLLELLDLKKNYELLNYSSTDINLHLLKLFSYPFYLILMTILSSVIMFNIKRYESSTFKISIGLLLSVLIYYMNNFSNILGKIEKIPLSLSIIFPLIIIMTINGIMLIKVNDK
ncbi:LptF/LptG family permease [Candidatus Pelagibacter sp.]|nr:LptF/LptG family permease [Candidatus Pelagibacter sp.]